MQSNAAHKVLYDGLYTFVMRVVNVVAAMALGVLTARILGIAGKGVYALPMVQAGLVATAFAGLSSSTTYFLLNGFNCRRVVSMALTTGTLFTAAGAIAIVAIALFGHTPWTILPAAASLPSTAIACIVTGYVIGVKRVRYATTLAVATTIATFVMMLAGLFLVGRTPSVAIFVWVAASSAVALVALIATVVHARRFDSGDKPVTLAAYLKLTMKVGAMNLVSLLNYSADLYIVALLGTPVQLGLYTVGVSASESLLVPTQVAALVTSPHIGSLEPEAAGRLAARCVRNNLLIAVCTCAILFLLAPTLVSLLYGPSFLPVVPALRILLIGVIALSLASPIATYFTLKLAKPEVPLVLSGLSALLCIVISVALFPHFGIVGAAVGSSAAYIIGQGVGLVYFSRTNAIPMRDMLVPTIADLTIYLDFLTRAYRDGRRLIQVRTALW